MEHCTIYKLLILKKHMILFLSVIETVNYNIIMDDAHRLCTSFTHFPYINSMRRIANLQNALSNCTVKMHCQNALSK